MDTLLKNTRDWLQTSTRRSFSAVLEEAKITPRQVEICELKFVKGLTNYQIAMQLPSCCVIDNNAALQVQATAAGTISNVSLSVVKMA